MFMQYCMLQISFNIVCSKFPSLFYSEPLSLKISSLCLILFFYTAPSITIPYLQLTNQQ